MAILIALIGLSAAGIGAVIWLIRSENNSDNTLSLSNARGAINLMEDISSPKVSSKPASSKEKSSLLDRLIPKKTKLAETDAIVQTPKSSSAFLSVIFKKFKLKKTSSEPQPQEASPLSILNNIIERKPGEDMNSSVQLDKPPTGTASIQTVAEEDVISDEDAKRIDKEIQLTTDLNEWKEKYARIDTLFTEKSSALEKAKESLENELNHRKEFNKIKDLLEKELKESKERTRNAQQELNAARSEGEAHKKRVLLLEEKIARLEKTLLEEKDKLEELRTTLTTPALSVANTPPPIIAEETKADETNQQVPTAESDQKSPHPIDIPPQSPAPIVEEPLPLDYDTPSEDSVQDGSHGFLKLQPDIISRLDLEGNQSPLEDSVETPQLSDPSKKIIDIIEPEKHPPEASNPNHQGPGKIDINTDNKKE